MWWRFKTFWEPFWRLLLWGETKWKGVLKVVSLAILIFGPSLASFWESPSGYLSLKILDREIISTPLRLSVLVAIIVGLLWVVFVIGRAYEMSGIPELSVETELILDSGFYRLFLESKEKDLDTKARLMKILDTKGEPLVPGRFPLELEWSHHSKESEVHLTAGFRESVSVAMCTVDKGTACIFFTGARHKGKVPIEEKDKIYFQVLIEYPKHKPIERWFCFQRLGGSFSASSERPPMLPQAVR